MSGGATSPQSNCDNKPYTLHRQVPLVHRKEVPYAAFAKYGMISANGFLLLCAGVGYPCNSRGSICKAQTARWAKLGCTCIPDIPIARFFNLDSNRTRIHSAPHSLTRLPS